MRTRMTWGSLFLAVACTGLFGAACTAERSLHVPAELVGVWQTDNEGYADHPLTIRGSSVTFGTGGDTSKTYVITNVQEYSFVGDRIYSIEFADSEGTPYDLVFFFRPGEEPEIRLRNKTHMVWTRRR